MKNWSIKYDFEAKYTAVLPTATKKIYNMRGLKTKKSTGNFLNKFIVLTKTIPDEIKPKFKIKLIQEISIPYRSPKLKTRFCNCDLKSPKKISVIGVLNKTSKTASRAIALPPSSCSRDCSKSNTPKKYNPKIDPIITTSNITDT